MKLRFELPKLKFEQLAKEYISELLEHGSEINGTGGLDINDYPSWLKESMDSHHGYEVNENRVPASTYFVFDEYDQLIGMCNIRHALNKHLIMSGDGHIGYSVRPTERKKGYATEILRQALEIVKNDHGVRVAILGCDKENIGSRKAILHNAGIQVREFLEEDGDITQVFDIELYEE